MQWLSDLWAGDNRFVQIAVVAACGIAVLVALALVYRLVFAHRLRVPGGRTRQPRLGLVDAFSLDGQRQLVLVRRDNVEHLVMIGGPNDVLLESQINRALAPPREAGPAAAGPPAPAPAPRRAEPVAAASPPAAAAAPAPAATPERAAPPAPPAAPAADVRPIPIRAKEQPAPVAAQAAALGKPVQEKPVQEQPAHDKPLKSAAETASRGAPAPARRTMPPPIAPLARANVTRLPEKPTPPPQPVQSAPAPNPAPQTAAAPHPASVAGAQAGTAKAETPERPAPVVKTDSAPHAILPGAGSNPAKAGPGLTSAAASAGIHGPVGGSLGAWAPPAAQQHPSRAETHGPAPHPEPNAEARADVQTPAAPASPPVTPSAPAQKPPPKASDPFAGLDSLEAEMAKLLGREKLN